MKYFVSFVFSDNSGNHFGNAEIVRDYPISDIHDITAIASQIATNYNWPEEVVIILFWREF